MMYAVIDMRTNRFVGLPCESLEEAIELRNQDEDNRSIFELGYVDIDEEECYNDDVDEMGFDPFIAYNALGRCKDGYLRNKKRTR